jgi:hypothetical protein
VRARASDLRLGKPVPSARTRAAIASSAALRPPGADHVVAVHEPPHRRVDDARYGRCPMLARAAALLAVVVTLAGCGSGGDGASGERAGYVRSLNAAQSGLAQKFTKLGEKITPTSSAKQDQATLGAYETVVDTTVRQLRAIDPPTGLERLHRRFVAQLSDYGSAVRTARGRISGDDPRAILAAQGRLQASLQRTGQQLNATIEAINKTLKG